MPPPKTNQLTHKDVFPQFCFPKEGGRAKGLSYLGGISEYKPTPQAEYKHNISPETHVRGTSLPFSPSKKEKKSSPRNQRGIFFGGG